MKVAVSGYIGKKITGIGRNLISLISNVSQENEYVIFVNHDMVDEFLFDSQSNVSIVPYGVSKEDSMGNLIWTTFKFPKEAKKIGADCSLIPNFTLLLFKYCPTAVIMHDLIEFNVPDKFSKLKMFYRTKLADPITAKRANRIMTVSQNSKKDLIKFLKVPESKIDIIYDGVNRSIFNQDSVDQEVRLKKLGIKQQFFLYAGTIDYPGKNVHSVVRAFERFCEAGIGSHDLVLAGMPGKGYEVVEQIIVESPVKDRIHLLGYVSDEDLVTLYSSCALFVFVSLYEGFGMPPLEALSCGANVVVSNVSSLPEVVGSVGLTVDPFDTTELSDVMISAARCELERPSEKKLEEHFSRFDWCELAREFEVFLQKAAE